MWNELFKAFNLSIAWSTVFIFCAILFTYKLNKKSYFIIRIISSIIIVVALETLLCYLLRKIEPANNYFLRITVSTLFFLGAIVLMTCALINCYHVNILEAFFFVIAAYSLEHFSNAAKTILLYFINMMVSINLSNILSNFIFNYLLKMLIAFAVFFFFLKKYLMKFQPNEMIDKRVLIISTINVVICLLLSQYKNFGNGSDTNKFTNQVICNIYAMFGCFLCLYLQFAYILEIKLKNDNHMLDVLFKEQNKANQLSKENIDLINVKFHDLKKQLRRIEENSTLVSNPELLNDLKNTVSIYDAFVKTGNGAIDTVLMNSYLTSLKNKIDFTYFVDGETLNYFESTDVVSLFDNLLDNAFEAVMKEEISNRVIHLQVYKEKQMAFINIRNYCSKKPKFVHGLPITTADPKDHGYGMKSINRTVNKYNGNLRCIWKDKNFNIKILIPIENNK